MARHPLRVGLLLLPLLLPPQLLASQATTAPLALPADSQAGEDLCVKLVAIRLGRLMDLHVTQRQALPGDRLLIEGEARQSQPPVGFACVMEREEKQAGATNVTPGWQLAKLELYQLQAPKELRAPN